MGQAYNTATQFASAEILCSAAADMLGDAAGILNEAKDEEGGKELSGLADKVGIAIEQLRRKRFAAEADKPAAKEC